MNCPNCHENPMPPCACGECPVYVPSAEDLFSCVHCRAIIQVLPDLTLAPATKEQARKVVSALAETLLVSLFAKKSQPNPTFGLN